MIRKPTITICLGSSCFARGNNTLIKKIQHYLEMNGLTDKVVFRGDHCFNNCSEGPNIFIGPKMFSGINEDNYQEILEEGLKELI